MHAHPRLLVVEDDPHVARMIRRMGQRRGYEVAVVGDVVSARAALGERQTAAMLLDLRLPGVRDGRDLLAELGDSAPPTVVYTATFDEYVMDLCLGYGAVEVWPKRLPVTDLFDRLDRIVGRTSAGLAIERGPHTTGRSGSLAPRS